MDEPEPLFTFEILDEILDWDSDDLVTMVGTSMHYQIQDHLTQDAYYTEEKINWEKEGF